MNNPVVVIDTDGCTAMPDGIGAPVCRECCALHDAGGSDGALLDCVTLAARDAGYEAAAPLIALAVAVMVLLRPVYNLGQRWGIFPKTKGSKL
jgi:hypothetical protein